tara:strand:+ start:753 stop:1130 length:378 start_codon:yes stop_codon:yes gene_type:complete
VPKGELEMRIKSSGSANIFVIVWALVQYTCQQIRFYNTKVVNWKLCHWSGLYESPWVLACEKQSPRYSMVFLMKVFGLTVLNVCSCSEKAFNNAILRNSVGCHVLCGAQKAPAHSVRKLRRYTKI